MRVGTIATTAGVLQLVEQRLPRVQSVEREIGPCTFAAAAEREVRVWRDASVGFIELDGAVGERFGDLRGRLTVEGGEVRRELIAEKRRIRAGALRARYAGC